MAKFNKNTSKNQSISKSSSKLISKFINKPSFNNPTSNQRNLTINSEIKGKLYIIPTPIGNLEDITLRAIRILTEVDIVLCEDTRVSSKLMQHLNLNKKLLSYHNFNEKSRINQIIDFLNQGQNIGLISDAGTPSISDPGFILVKELVQLNYEIVSIPGAVAFITALVASGMDTDSFIFLGFPPQKKGRQTFIKNLVNYNLTKIMYESPHRIAKLIKELDEAGYSEKKVCVSRELTKIHEEYIRGSVSEVKHILENRDELKGEITVILE